MSNVESNAAEGETRRDFIHVAAGGFVAIGGAMAVWPFIDQMNPAADTLALATVEVDVSSIEPGGALQVLWRGKPVFVRRRTEQEMETVRSVEVDDLKDPQADAERASDKKPQWLVVVGVCTHLGCVPVGTKPGDERGEFGGWFCPCHGSHYDASGRIRKGPAPRNLEVPQYSFVSDNVIKIG